MKIIYAIAYLAASAICLASLCESFPNIEVSWSLWKDLYGVEYFQSGKLALTFILVVFGWFYMNLATKKKEILSDGCELAKLLALVPLIFLIAGNYAIMGPYDTQIVSCDENGVEISNTYLVNHVSCQKFMEVPGVIPFSERLIYNFLLFVLPFFVGLNYTMLDVGRLQNISISPVFIRRWQLFEWTVALSSLALIIGLLSVLFIVYLEMGRLLYYGLGLLITTVATIALCVAVRKKYHFHLHHFNLFLLLACLIGIQRWWATFIHALFMGITVEGGCRWGVAPPLAWIPTRDWKITEDRMVIIVLDENGVEISRTYQMYDIEELRSQNRTNET